MVVIRLSRTGAKKRPFYHVVATDKRHARSSGNFIERLGYYNPIARGGEIKLHLEQERITYWLGKGAQTSERVSSLLEQAKQLAEGKTTTVDKARAKKKAKIATKQEAAKKAAAAAAAEETAAAEAPAVEETPAADEGSTEA